MRKILLAIAVFGLLSLSAFAQNNSKFDFFAGYSYLHVDQDLLSTDNNIPGGFELQGTGYFTKNFGITADYSGHFKTISGVDLRAHNFLFGPTVRADVGKAAPFAHFLLGGTRLTASSGIGEDTVFSYAFGGGLDVHAGRNISVRLGQVDWLRTNVADQWQNNVRFSAGIVFNLGSH